MFTLDTNAVIYHLRDEPSIRELINQSLGGLLPLYISAISVTELLRFPKLSSQEESSILELLSALSVVPVDLQIAHKAGEIGRAYNIKLADSIIAATALFTGSPLLTRNVRDFRRVPSLSLQNI